MLPASEIQQTYHSIPSISANSFLRFSAIPLCLAFVRLLIHRARLGQFFMTSCSSTMIFVHNDDLIHQAADSDSVRSNQHSFIIDCSRISCLCPRGWVKIRGRFIQHIEFRRPLCKQRYNATLLPLSGQTAPCPPYSFLITSFS